MGLVNGKVVSIYHGKAKPSIIKRIKSILKRW